VAKHADPYRSIIIPEHLQAKEADLQVILPSSQARADLTSKLGESWVHWRKLPAATSLSISDSIGEPLLEIVLREAGGKLSLRVESLSRVERSTSREILFETTLPLAISQEDGGS
jgi:hypothetical protein